MKNIGLTLVAVWLLASGCATTAPEQPTQAAATAAPEKTAKTVIDIVPYVLKETTFHSDGVPDDYRVYTWDGSLLQKEELFDASSNDRKETVAYSYRAGVLTEKKILDGQGQQRSRRVFEYNGARLLSAESIYDRKDSLQAVSRYTYDAAGQKTEWATLDSAQVVLAVTKYSYAQERIDAITIQETGGNVDIVIKVTYDGTGNRVKETFTNAGGRVEKTVTYSYDPHNRLLEEKTLTPSGSVLALTAYEYGELAAPVKINHYDARGNLRGWMVKEYATREVKRTVYE